MKRALAVLFAAAVLATPVLGQQSQAAGAASNKKLPIPPEKAVATHHSVTIDGQAIKYTATAGNLLVTDEKGDTTGSFFYVAYTKDGADLTTRPVTFLYNGGPGSASIWLHMGSFAPVRVVVDDANATPPAPYALNPNPYSLIDRTDLVFVDAIGTGFSQIVGTGEDKDFYGVDADIRSFADFITRYVTVNGRWNSPKFLLGESYGTTRSAGLANALDERGMPLNGVVLVSSWLDGYVDFGNPPFAMDIQYELFLPTMAATAWYHDKVPNKPADLSAFVQQVREFALGDYAHALAQGSHLGESERAAIVAKLHAYTGLPEDFIRDADLRITPARFEKELLRGERRTVGRLDARYEGIDHDAAGEQPEYDPTDAAINGPFTTAFNNYLKSDLNYQSDRRYLTSGDVGRDWDWHHRVDGQRWPMFDVAEDLRLAMTKNPDLQVFSANGYFDFATPLLETEYTLDHMGLDPSLEKNITYGYYQSGHMIYLHTDALAKLKKDLGAWYDNVLARSGAAQTAAAKPATGTKKR
jgi:carboxypeptidase C (cathepsin A)